MKYVNYVKFLRFYHNYHWRKSWWGCWGLSPTSEGGEQFSRKTLKIRITICWIKQSFLQLSSFQLQWQGACFHLICRFHKLTLILAIHFTGLRPCNCIFVPIHDFALICEGFIGYGIKGTKVKKPNEKYCPFPPVRRGVNQPALSWLFLIHYINFQKIKIFGVKLPSMELKQWIHWRPAQGGCGGGRPPTLG